MLGTFSKARGGRSGAEIRFRMRLPDKVSHRMYTGNIIYCLPETTRHPVFLFAEDCNLNPRPSVLKGCVSSAQQCKHNTPGDT